MWGLAYQSFIITFLTLFCYPTSLLVKMATGELLAPPPKSLRETYEIPALSPETFDHEDVSSGMTASPTSAIDTLPSSKLQNSADTVENHNPNPSDLAGSSSGNLRSGDVEVGMIKVVPMSMNDGLVNGQNIGEGQPPWPISRPWTHVDLQSRLRWLTNKRWTHFDLAYDHVILLPDSERARLKERDQVMKAAARYGYEHLDSKGFAKVNTPLVTRWRVSLSSEAGPLDVFMDKNLQQLIRSQLLPPMETNYESAISLEDIVLRSYQAILSQIRSSYKLPKQTDVGQTLFDPVWNPGVFEVAGFSPSALRFFFVLHEMLQDFYLLLASERSSIASSRGEFSVGLAWLRQKWRQSNISNFIIGERYQNHKKYKKLRNMKEYQSHGPEKRAKPPRQLDSMGPPVSENQQPLENERVTSNGGLSAPENQGGQASLRDQLSTIRRRSILHPFEYSPISPKAGGGFRPEEFYRQAKQFQQNHVHNTHGDMSFEEAAALLENIFHDYSDGFNKLYATYSQIDKQFWPHFRWSVGAARRP